MAARIRKIRHDDNTRAKIHTTQLVKRLTAHAFGEVELGNSQVRAIEVLLRKTLPDLQATQHSGNEENPVRLIVTGVPRAGRDDDNH